MAAAGARNDLEVTFQRRVRVRLVQLIDELSTGLVERDAPVRLALLAALASEHTLTAAQIFERHFSDDVDAFDDYVSDPENQLHTAVAFEPVLQIVAGEGTSSRAAQLAELAADLRELLAALTEHAAAFDAEPLWLPRAISRSIGTAMKESSARLTESTPGCTTRPARRRARRDREPLRVHRPDPRVAVRRGGQ